MAIPTNLNLDDPFHSIVNVIEYAHIFKVKMEPVPAGHIFYDRHELVKLFFTIYKSFVPPRAKQDQSETLRITFRPEANTLRIQMAWRNYLLTSARWEGLITLLKNEDSYEYLYEFGGSIEPLAWGEGVGQGVIVTLPWAREIL